MAVKIRLKRIGARKNPFYRIVVADARYPRDGRFIEQIGVYDPMTNPAKISIDGGRALYWMKNGAQPTDTVRALIKNTGALEKAREEEKLKAERGESVNTELTAAKAAVTAAAAAVAADEGGFDSGAGAAAEAAAGAAEDADAIGGNAGAIEENADAEADNAGEAEPDAGDGADAPSDI